MQQGLRIQCNLQGLLAATADSKLGEITSKPLHLLHHWPRISPCQPPQNGARKTSTVGPPAVRPRESHPAAQSSLPEHQSPAGPPSNPHYPTHYVQVY